jgi:hypothetical protein
MLKPEEPAFNIGQNPMLQSGGPSLAQVGGPSWNIGECPMPQIGGPDLAGAPSACKFFRFGFKIDEDFGEDGILKKDVLRKAMTEIKILSSIDQPRGNIERTVESLANDLAEEVRDSGEEASDQFEQFSATVLVEVMN